MDQSTFDSKLQEWQTLPGIGDGIYFDHPAWKEIGTHPVDLRFTALAELYLASNSEQRQFIRDHFKGQDDRLWEMIFYVRRTAKLIQLKDDAKWLKLGLTVAAIQGGRVDFRDLSISLVILCYAAERVGIDPVPFVDEILQIAGPSTYEMFHSMRTHPASGQGEIVERFGPEDWAAEIKGSPDHNTMLQGDPR